MRHYVLEYNRGEMHCVVLLDARDKRDAQEQARKFTEGRNYILELELINTLKSVFPIYHGKHSTW